MRPTNTKIDATLARYLLGDLSPDQADEKSIVDESYMERLNLTESALICDFICGGLSDDDRERLERRFLRLKEKARKVELAQFLYYKAHRPASFDDEDPAFEYLLSDHSEGERPELEERAQSDENFKARLDYAEYELIFAYLRGGLPSSGRERFERYFLRAEAPNHAERIEKLRFTEIFCAYARRHGIGEFSRGSRLYRIRRWLAEPFSVSMSRPAWQPLVAVSVIGLGALIWAVFSYQSPITKGLNALQAAYAQERPVEARLTGFDYAAYRVDRAGNIVASDRRKRDKAFGLIIGLADEGGTPAAYHALGKIYLTDKNFNEAVKYLDLALRQNAGDVKLRNDLAVALMEREKAKNPGQSTGEDMALALEHLHRAIELDGSLLEARFNLALCHQYLMLWRTAEEDWKRYLEKDSSSLWAEEARKNFEKVTERIKKGGEDREKARRDFLEAYRRGDVEQAWLAYKRGRQSATGSFITESLLDNYLSLALSGRSAEAGESLSALSFIGDLEAERVEDRFSYDLSMFYRGRRRNNRAKFPPPVKALREE
jgi:tetratricopeptide (TPR) repeat protein